MKHRIYLFLLLLLCGISLPSLSGLLVFPFSAVPTELTLAYTLILSVIFLSTAIFLRRQQIVEVLLANLLWFFHSFFGNIFRFLGDRAIRNNEWTSFRYVGKHFNNCKHDNSLDSNFGNFFRLDIPKERKHQIRLDIWVNRLFLLCFNFYSSSTIPVSRSKSKLRQSNCLAALHNTDCTVKWS